MPTPTKLVAEAAARRLAEAGVAVWNPTGMYTADQKAITIKAVPQDPDQVIALTVYSKQRSPNPDLTDEVVMLQVRVRAGRYPTDVDDLADAADVALSGHHLEWPGLTVARAHRVSYMPLGPDSNGRHETTMNYELRLSH